MEQFGRKVFTGQELMKEIYGEATVQADWLENYIHLDEETFEKVRPDLVKLLKLFKETKNKLIKIDQKINV